MLGVRLHVTVLCVRVFMCVCLNVSLSLLCNSGGEHLPQLELPFGVDFVFVHYFQRETTLGQIARSCPSLHLKDAVHCTRVRCPVVVGTRLPFL